MYEHVYSHMHMCYILMSMCSIMYIISDVFTHIYSQVYVLQTHAYLHQETNANRYFLHNLFIVFIYLLCISFPMHQVYNFLFLHKVYHFPCVCMYYSYIEAKCYAKIGIDIRYSIYTYMYTRTHVYTYTCMRACVKTD